MSTGARSCVGRGVRCLASARDAGTVGACLPGRDQEPRAKKRGWCEGLTSAYCPRSKEAAVGARECDSLVFSGSEKWEGVEALGFEVAGGSSCCKCLPSLTVRLYATPNDTSFSSVRVAQEQRYLYADIKIYIDRIILHK